MSDASLARPVDERTLHFSPWGLGGAMAPEASAELLRRTMEAYLLPTDVPSEVRSQFDKLRTLYCDGLFTYDAFTRVARDSGRVLEVALKVRFLNHYATGVPLIVNDRPDVRQVVSFDQVHQLLGRRARDRGAQLNGYPRFDGSFAALVHWARAERYFYGQRNRFRERGTIDFRNDMTHTEHDSVSMPPDAEKDIRLLFEMICRLWACDRLPAMAYPPPLPRSAWVIAFGPQEREATWFPLDHSHMIRGEGRENRRWYVVLATEWEELGLWQPDFEITNTPVEPLWGPASWEELMAEVARSASTWPSDTVQVLDRLFYLRKVEGNLEMPRSQQHVRALKDRRGEERWVVVRADSPGDAYGHAREALGGRHPIQGTCDKCPAEGVIPLARRETVDRFIRDVVPTLARSRGSA